MPKLPDLTRLGALAAGLLCGAAQATEPPPQLGRYLPLYPGLYFNGGYARDERDASYDQGGREVATAAPSLERASAFPETRYEASLSWYFPMFESAGLLFFSDRLHMARVTLRYVDTRTEGGLADFVADTSDDAATAADGLRNNGKGIGDTTLEFGSFLWGSQDWRSRQGTPLSVLLLLGLNLPSGVYEHESPNTAGSNHWAWTFKLGAHWQPWRGGFLDAAYGLRAHLRNYEPQFGRLAPSEQGDDRLWDASFAQRVLPGLYVTAFATDRKGDPNEYWQPFFAPNAPEAPPAIPPNYSSRNFPTPGTYRDGGTALRSYGLAVQYFPTQRWLLALHYTQPQSGRSGQFLLPFTNRQCTLGGGQDSATCNDSAAGEALVDGFGPARSFASDSLMFTATYNFGQGDAFTCTGCKQ